METKTLDSSENDRLTLGYRSSTVNVLDGTIQEIIIFPTDKTTDLPDLHTDINSYYSIY